MYEIIARTDESQTTSNTQKPHHLQTHKTFVECKNYELLTLAHYISTVLPLRGSIISLTLFLWSPCIKDGGLLGSRTVLSSTKWKQYESAWLQSRKVKCTIKRRSRYVHVCWPTHLKNVACKSKKERKERKERKDWGKESREGEGRGGREREREREGEGEGRMGPIMPEERGTNALTAHGPWF